MPHTEPTHDEDTGQYSGHLTISNEVDNSVIIINFGIEVEGVGDGPGFDAEFQAIVDAMANLFPERSYLSASKAWKISKTFTPTPSE